MSDILMVCYSRTGKTRLLAEKLAALLNADLDEIQEGKSRSGAMGFMSGGWDTLMKREVRLSHVPDPSNHATIILGMPIWAFQPPAPVRAWLRQVDLSGKTVCAFCTSDGSKGAGTFKALNAVLPAPLAETFEWIKPKPDDTALDDALKTWAHKLRALAGGAAG